MVGFCVSALLGGMDCALVLLSGVHCAVWEHCGGTEARRWVSWGGIIQCERGARWRGLRNDVNNELVALGSQGAAAVGKL
jgi:hypothetical protein